MDDTLYGTDILAWSEQQADVLRRLAAGARVNDQVDWGNVIEEIESVGNEQLHAVESLLVQALRHILKVHCWPRHRDAPTWRADALDFRGQAQRRFAPSMRQKIDIERIYRHASGLCRRRWKGLRRYRCLRSFQRWTRCYPTRRRPVTSSPSP